MTGGSGNDGLTDVVRVPNISHPNPECQEQKQGNGENLMIKERTRELHSSTGSAEHASGNKAKMVKEDEDPYILGLELLRRFERTGDIAALQQAISLLETSISSSSPLDDRCAVRLKKFGVALSYRFRHLGGLSNLEQAISRLTDAVNLTPDGHPGKPSCLNDLGNTFLIRFQQFGELHDLEQAISTCRSAVGFASDDHPDKHACLNGLGISLRARFQRFWDLRDLDQVISLQKSAIDLVFDGHPDKPGHLDNLGTTFRARFQHLGELHDLDQAISWQRDAGNLTPDDHPSRPGLLSNLGMTLLARFKRLGELHDLEQAISKCSQAVELIPDGHPDKPGHLNNLGLSFLTRSKRLTSGELYDLEQAILVCSRAVDLTPDGHPMKPTRLNNLGISLKDRFKRRGELHDLEQAILRQGDAVGLTPEGHGDKPIYLTHLGNSFLARFEHSGELHDLEQAMQKYRDAVDLIPDGHPEKSGYLNNLGKSFLSRFNRFGELHDIEQAISWHGRAVDLLPDGHPDKPVRLNSLGNSFLARFERLGELRDLEQAVLRYRDVVDLTPDDHPDKPGRQNNLGNSLLTRFHRIKELHDLDQAMTRYRIAVDLTPDGHPSKHSRLNNLANSFQARFDHIGELNDLEQAILWYKDAVDLTPDGHPDKPSLLHNHGMSLLARFKRLGELHDLQQAILLHDQAINLSPEGHPSRPLYLKNLGLVFATRFISRGDPRDLQKAISLYSRAARASSGVVAVRFRASKDWIACATDLRHHTLLRAFSVAIDLLPQLAWIGLSLTHRYRELIQGTDVVREAAAAALEWGLPETAVEWLEQGRSVVWGELFQLRGSYEDLSSVHPDHASRLRRLSAALEHASATRDKSLSSLSEHTQGTEHRAAQSLEQEAAEHRELAIERDRLLQEIRKLPGFERFLLHKRFSQLRAAAHAGPVVILNAAKSRCDALVVRADVDHVIHVPLPNLTFERSDSLHNSMKNLVRDTRDIAAGIEREGRRGPQRAISWEAILSTLWHAVVKPVLDALAISTPGQLSRIFWCPTGPFMFLPIHAAGLYDAQHSQPGHKVFDFVVSSYLPTLSILATPPTKPDNTPSSGLRLLAVRQPPSDGQAPLPGVDLELQHIKGVVRRAPSTQTSLLESSAGTVEEVLGLMRDAHWVHFACHGVQDGTSPTDSGLCLADGRRLKLSDIIALSRPRGGLAFLSACQTARGDRELPDEAIHIAAGMLFAGYGGVIGTMWSIRDSLAPRVTKDVYEQLLRKGETPDHLEAARALHAAVGRLRESGASFVEWLPFIHVGL